MKADAVPIKSLASGSNSRHIEPDRFEYYDDVKAIEDDVEIIEVESDFESAVDNESTHKVQIKL